MTHSGGKPHTNIGDRGQRFEVSAIGYPKDGKNVIGWAATEEGANEMAAAIRLAPGCTSTTIRDRQKVGIPGPLPIPDNDIRMGAPMCTIFLTKAL
jgi:hypothetical protein